MPTLPKLESLDVAGRTVLVRLDLNVPMTAGRITDATRIHRILPTLQYLLERHAKIVILSHLGRPQQFDPSLSLAPLVDALSAELWDRPVRFCPDCIGSTARQAIDGAAPGDVILMENLRFYPEEEAGDAAFAAQLAQLGDCYVNDAFSCSHRAHASIVGIPAHLPHAAGRLMGEEIAALSAVLESPQRPVTAIVGGAKVSSKLALLSHLVGRVERLVIGGAMANTFLLAQGMALGASRVEAPMVQTALGVLAAAQAQGCEIILPVDAVVAQQFKPRAASRVVPVTALGAQDMILDIGPASLRRIEDVIERSRTLLWNGPVGAFETPPFDSSTVQIARIVAAATASQRLHSVAGGGDTVFALNHAGLAATLSYVSTAGGAFLEWLEGATLPGIAALMPLDEAAARRHHG